MGKSWSWLSVWECTMSLYRCVPGNSLHRGFWPGPVSHEHKPLKWVAGFGITYRLMTSVGFALRSELLKLWLFISSICITGFILFGPFPWSCVTHKYLGDTYLPTVYSQEMSPCTSWLANNHLPQLVYWNPPHSLYMTQKRPATLVTNIWQKTAVLDALPNIDSVTFAWVIHSCVEGVWFYIYISWRSHTALFLEEIFHEFSLLTLKGQM